MVSSSIKPSEEPLQKLKCMILAFLTLSYTPPVASGCSGGTVPYKQRVGVEN